MTRPSNWLLSFEINTPARTLATHGVRTLTRSGRTIALHGRLDEHPPASRPQFRGDDAAAILDAFEQQGLDALPTLRGVFVVALADETADRLIVARDPLGMHPLFWARAGSRVLMADSTRHLAQQAGISRELNRTALADHLCHRWPSATETFFSAIRRIPPGSLLDVKNGDVDVRRYWDPAPVDRPIEWIADEEVPSFSRLLDRSIERCTSTDKVGIFLSGGLDSISVAAAATDIATRRHICPPTALSLAMADPECAERDTQTAVAKSLGLRQHIIPFNDAVGPAGLVRRGVELGRQLSSPLLNIWGPAYESLASLAARDGVSTILTGSGGDEWLSVSPYLSADLIARGDAGSWWNLFRSLQRSYRRPVLSQLQLTVWTYGLRPLASRHLRRLFHGKWEARRQRKMARNDPTWVAPDPAVRSSQLARVEAALDAADPQQGFYLREVRSGLDHPLTSWELEEQYEFGGRIGVSYRHPYWDPDLVDMLYRTPPEQLSRGGRAKGLVREELARRFPGLGLDRQRKVSATRYLGNLLDAELQPAAAEIGECRALADLGVISAGAMHGYCQAGFARPTARWDIVSLETWVRANR